jgi:signal transduction histidine kinase
MKLLTKTTLYYITISLFIFFVLGIVIYKLVKRLEDVKVNQELYDQSHRFSHELDKSNIDLENTLIISSGLIQLIPVPSIIGPKVQLSDTLMLDPIHNAFVPYRCLSYYLNINGIFYKMSIYKSMLESNYLIEQVALVITSIVILFLLTVYFLYRYSFGRIWSDFFLTVKKIENFDLSSPGKIEFPSSMIIEFNQLNGVLKKMIDRISSDFQGLKEFTGNLSHELQTPLAIIRSKADLLLQDSNSNENQMKLAGEINAETIRLSKLAKALSLFTKLDHHQFSNLQQIYIESIIRSKLELFVDFIEARRLSLNFNILAKPKIEMNPELADILFVNLIKNAIRHNLDEGKIEIELNTTSFKIRNTGAHIDFDPETMFNRFSKLSKTSESLGIGLSIVKKICDYYDFRISYSHNNGIHELFITFINNLD